MAQALLKIAELEQQLFASQLASQSKDSEINNMKKQVDTNDAKLENLNDIILCIFIAIKMQLTLSLRYLIHVNIIRWKENCNKFCSGYYFLSSSCFALGAIWCRTT